MSTKNTKALQVLTLMYGRFNEEDEQSSVLLGPMLTGITKLAYCNLTIRLYFDSKESLAEAKRQTGWEQYNDKSLIMPGFNNYIVTNVAIPNSDARSIVYYSHWDIEAIG
ncbi:hypothetical protein MTZ49_10650 [Entomomonas sp. E2T0]|uniref:hypothetical protein n=1 Tax=Entomomonas sp. E2T0 TaxID=2930213 RepID=UPI0022283E8E|nr:hypothetical protein [Entomomonas sp. E2T0]UYZ83061.1 hypothetical protein MTZ49_10650 [Entomomonas sp. E2T0]